MALDEVKAGRSVGFRIFIMVAIVGYVMTYGAFGTDPGWNPGLNEMEAPTMLERFVLTDPSTSLRMTDAVKVRGGMGFWICDLRFHIEW